MGLLRGMFGEHDKSFKSRQKIYTELMLSSCKLLAQYTSYSTNQSARTVTVYFIQKQEDFLFLEILQSYCLFTLLTNVQYSNACNSGIVNLKDHIQHSDYVSVVIIY